MAIVFHCEYCGKKIEAKDSAGGKWGKCPACHNKLYVPGPDSADELKLAPIDESEETREQKLMAETFELTQDILSEKDASNGFAEPASAEINEKELIKNIIMYLRQMADGELKGAQQTANLITPYHRQVGKILNQLSTSERPEPELADIPKQVLAGLMKELRSKT